MNNADLVTLPQATEILQTTRPTLYRWLREGQLVGVKVGRQWRFDRAELERFLQGGERQVDLPADLSPFLETLKSQLVDPTPRERDPLKTAFAWMVELALQRDAGSLHLATCYTDTTPERESWLRCRVDGQLQTLAPLDPRLVAPLIEHWKREAGCDIRETALPQDGRIIVSSLAVDEEPAMIDLRVSFLPAMLGESMTVRVLDRRRSRLRLGQLELAPRDRALLDDALRQRGRTVVIGGATGSARGTVLAACLREVSGPECKLMSVESQAWQFLPWATQIPLSNFGPRRSYAAAVRTVLRGDPDVVGVEKVSEADTLEAVADGALQGALMVVGMDAGDAVSTLWQLAALSGSRVSLSQTLILVLSQRLMRKLCSQCNQPHNVAEDELDQLNRRAHAGGAPTGQLRNDFRKAVGCRTCGGSGYRKRTMLVETVRFTALLARMLDEGATLSELRRTALEDGLVTFEAQAIDLAATGVTSLEEVYRAFPGLAAPFPEESRAAK